MTQNTDTGQTPSSTSSISTPMIIFNGRLSIVDENYESVYDSMDLSRGKAEQPILSIETTNDGQLGPNWQNSLNTSLLSPPHYGYQGLWTPNWITTTYTITLNNNSSAPTSANSIAEQKKLVKHSLLIAQLQLASLVLKLLQEVDPDLLLQLMYKLPDTLLL